MAIREVKKVCPDPYLRDYCAKLLSLGETWRLIEHLGEDWDKVISTGLDRAIADRISRSERGIGYIHGIARGMLWGTELARHKKSEPRETILGILRRNPELSNQRLCERLDSLGRADVRPLKAVPSWNTFLEPRASWVAALNSMGKN
jgi:hypothetical protein